MPDEEERETELEALVDDALLTEVLMSWDGDRCLCTECRCTRFMNGPDLDDPRCDPCRRGEHDGVAPTAKS